MRQKSIKKNAFLSMIQSFVSMAFPLITFPYAARVLGVSGIGRYNFSYTFVNYFALIASLGINTYAVREGARLREDKKKLEEFASEVFSINVVSTILAYILLIVLTATVTKFRGYASVIMILSGKIICDTLGRNWLYALYEDYAFITIRSIISQIFSLVLLFLLVKGPGDIELYAFVSVSSTIISGILNLIFSCKYCGLQFSWKLEKKHIVPILLIFSTTVSIIIYSNTDITILGFFGTDKHIGLYSSSVKVYNIIKQIIAASLTVSIPRFSYYLGNKMFAEYNHLYNKITNTLLTLVIPAIAGLMFLSQEIIVLACGEEFIEAWKSLSILSVSMFFNLMTYLLGYCVLIPHRKEKNFFLLQLQVRQ